MSGKPNYAMAIQSDISAINDTYTNARYAPVGTNSTGVGLPFPAYKEFGGRFTQWQPSSLSMSSLKQQMNLPTDTTTFRRGLTSDAIGTGNESLKDWTAATQTLSNISFDTMYCTSNADCSAFGQNYTCNSNYSPWPDAHGNQSGSSCSFTAYPELKDGTYFRKLTSEGGIGKACNTDSECASGYECNNETDFVGKNVQQTGYCAQSYTCPDGKKRYLGYPFNSGIPQVPPPDQNNNGLGYSSKQECSTKAMAQQNCLQDVSGNWFAVYPGYCPIEAIKRQGPNGQGALSTTSVKQSAIGFQIPAYATNMASAMGGTGPKAQGALGALGRGVTSGGSGMSEPLQYSLMINPAV